PVASRGQSRKRIHAGFIACLTARVVGVQIGQREYRAGNQGSSRICNRASQTACKCLRKGSAGEQQNPTPETQAKADTSHIASPSGFVYTLADVGKSSKLCRHHRSRLTEIRKRRE